MEVSDILAGLDPQDCTPEAICVRVAKIFKVKKTEVALLEADRSLLKFVYPAELRTAGAIPLSSSAVAARTARSKRADVFNSFTKVKHSSIFEVVKLGESGSDAEFIQKLMSAPVLSPTGEVTGVIQVSRKAHAASAAGPDFTPDDLEKLKAIAGALGQFMIKGR